MKEALFFCIVGLPLFGKECSGTPVFKTLVRALSYGVFLRLLSSLEQNGRNPRIYSKTCFNDKPKLTLTYFNIIKDMRESRNFRQGGPGQSVKKSSDVFVFF